MKSVHFCILIFCASIALPGCGGSPSESKLANDDITADDIAKYEADLAAVSGDDAYEDAQDDDAGTADTGAGDAGTGDESAE